MRPSVVIKAQILADGGARLCDTVIGVQVHLLIFHASPKSFDEDIVPPGALAVHADLDLSAEQKVGKVGTGELAPLIGVEDLRFAMPSERFLDSLMSACRS